MPIKLPKGFSRRKSSGNALDEVEVPAQSSFRVFERPPGERRSFNDGSLLSRNLSEPLHPPAEDTENIFAGSEKPLPKDRYRLSRGLGSNQKRLTVDSGSGGTDQSGITGGMYESSSSVRFSSSSTCPSSTEVPAPDDSQSPHSRGLYDIPVPPLAGALRAAGRTFSFGGRLSKTSTPPPLPRHSTTGPSRDRAMTASTASTATPPKLLDTDLNLGKMEDFQGVFDKIGMRDDKASEGRLHDKRADMNSRLPLTRSTTTPLIEGNMSQPAPIHTDRSKLDDHSPYSWDDCDSEDQPLFALASRKQTTPAAAPDLPRSDHILNSNSVSIPTTSHRSLERPMQKSRKALRRSLVYTDKRESSFIEDDDAKLVRESLLSKSGTPTPLQRSPDVENEAPLFESAPALDLPGQSRLAFASEARNAPTVSDSQPDASIAAHARLAAQYEQRQPKSSPSPTKVMTPSQFEHYRQQQELKRSNSDASKSDDSAESEFDEEDETEKNREAERQRRKQEAHLSVYRQQMMKVIGQQSPASSLRPEMNGTNVSSSNLTTPSYNQGNKSGSGKSSEGDDDDDIPLGILAAHGFPNRNRPPAQLGPSKSIPNLRASFHPHASSPGHMSQEHEAGNRGSLPVFARNLPRDPYFGAGLVNSPNRESLALGGGTSVYGSPSSILPPGGLVGVIATEERARAMRRGSPNPPALYDHQFGMSGMNPCSNPYAMMPQNSHGMLVPPQHGLSPAENSQMQLSQQMTQMMQTQMQWMQQMMQMQGIQSPAQPQMPSPYHPSLASNTSLRPASMPSGPAFSIAPRGPHTDQRTLSMLDPNIPRWNGPPMSYHAAGGKRPGTPSAQGYAPSIAPSERSNVGMAPRYRPVSTIPQEQRPNTMSPGPKQWSDENRKPFPIASQSQFHLEKMAPTPTVTIHPVPSDDTKPLDDEADDDEGWAEMMRKRERKKHGWSAKRATSPLGDLMNVVH